MPDYYAYTGGSGIYGYASGTYYGGYYGTGTYNSNVINPRRTWDPFWTYTHTTSSAANAYNQQIWQAWNTIATTNIYSNPPVQLAPERTARDELIVRNRTRASDLRRNVAERRAEALLRENLTDEQREEYDRLKRFHVIAGGKTYRIRWGWAGNIELIEDGRPVERWCVHPYSSIPVPDNLLSQKLMLECGQAEELRRIANVERLWHGVAV